MFTNTDFTLFGVSWNLVASILVSLVRRYWAAVPEEGIKVGAALFMVLGFFLDKTYYDEQWMMPATPEAWIGMALQLLVYFGQIMGLAPGNTAGQIYRGIKRRIVGR
jgi:hypothetical protein